MTWKSTINSSDLLKCDIVIVNDDIEQRKLHTVDESDKNCKILAVGMKRLRKKNK